MEILNQIIDAAKKSAAQISLADADDPLVRKAAVRAHQARVAADTLVGESENIQATAHSLALNIDELTSEDVHHSEHRAALVDALVQRRYLRGMTVEKAQAQLNDPLVFANMLVHCNKAQEIGRAHV